MNVFISFHFEEWDFFNQLTHTLRREGHAAYLIDLKGILGINGIFDLTELSEELRNTDIVIVVLSKRYIDDDWLREELRAIFAMEKNYHPNFLLPVLYGDIKDEEIPDYLKHKSKVDFRKGFTDKAVKALKQSLLKMRPKTNLLIFISHSSHDIETARSLIDLLRSTFGLQKTAIRCTSVPGFQLPPGVNLIDRLKREIYEAKIFLGLITPSSMQSVFVLFELGARWGAKRPLLPVLAGGAKPDLLRGPLSTINAVNCSEPSQIRDLINTVALTLDPSKSEEELDLIKVDETQIEQLVNVCRMSSQ